MRFGKSIFGIILILIVNIHECYTKPIFHKKIKIAVIDTGLDIKDPRFKGHICKSGHKNFVLGESLEDVNGHGTFVSGLIQQHAKKSNYCMVIYKYYKDSDSGENNEKREMLSLEEAINSEVDVVNFSGGGSVFSEEEATFIKNNPQITFVVAAGNNGKNLDIPGNEYYPASLFYKNMKVVKNIDENGNLSFTSNYSKKTDYAEIGEHVESFLPNGQTGYMSGTSMSTAIHSGKLIFNLYNNQEN